MRFEELKITSSRLTDPVEEDDFFLDSLMFLKYPGIFFIKDGF